MEADISGFVTLLRAVIAFFTTTYIRYGDISVSLWQLFVSAAITAAIIRTFYGGDNDAN